MKRRRTQLAALSHIALEALHDAAAGVLRLDDDTLMSPPRKRFYQNRVRDQLLSKNWIMARPCGQVVLTRSGHGVLLSRRQLPYLFTPYPIAMEQTDGTHQDRVLRVSRQEP
jgi:hypothetical protein